MTTSTRVERLEAQATTTTDPIASGRYSVSMTLNFDGGPATYEVTDTTTGELVPLTADIAQRIEALERARRKAGHVEELAVTFADATKGAP